MPRPDRITPAFARRCSGVVQQCRDVGADSLAWETHLIDALRTLVGAKVGIVGNMRHFASGRTQSVRSLRRGWADAAEERTWLEYVDRVPVERTPEYPLLSRIQERLITRTRSQLWPEAEWRRSRAFNEVHKPAGIDDYIISIRQQPGVSIQHSVWVHRGVGEPPFTRRDWWAVRFVHEQIGARIGLDLASAAEPGLDALPPRQRQVLDLLLDGDSEKEAAATLGIAPATLHEHVLKVYAHFGVASRAELMAAFVGRARPPRAPTPPATPSPPH